jgi:hypothetical protein
MLEYLLDVERNMDESIYEYNGHRLNMKDKIGVGIAIDDVPDNALFFNECERDYWAKKPTLPVYKMPSKIHMLPAPVDTTFALYDYNRIQFYGLGGCRTIDITLRHIPYYFTPDNFYDDLPAIKEFRNYLRTATLSSTAKATLINNSIQL